MNSIRTCSTCKHWYEVEGTKGECHADVPSCTSVQTVSQLTQTPVLRLISYWPPVEASKWCGKHEFSFQSQPD